MKRNLAIYYDQGETGQGDDPNGWRNGIKDCIDMLNKTTCTMLDDITQRHNSMYDDKIIYVTVATHGHSTSLVNRLVPENASK